MKKLNMYNKMVALFLAMLMIITSVSAATTVRLEKYPEPFIKEGKLDNTVFVIGENAASSDVLGGMQVASSLQTEAVTKEIINPDVVSPPTVSEGKRIGNSGNFNYDKSIRDVQSGFFDSDELPVVLGKTEFKLNGKPYNGNQRLQFGETVGVFEFMNPEDKDRGDYVSIRENQKVYEFTYDVGKGVSYDSSDIAGDFKGEKITIQGNEYQITEANGNNGKLNALRLDRKETVVWLIEDQPYVFGEHTLRVIGVDSQQTKCIIDVDGVTKSIRDGKSDTVSGVSVFVSDVLARHRVGKNDICEVSLGNTAIVLRDSQSVMVNGAKLHGSNVAFEGSAGSWNGFTITYMAGDESKAPNDDDIFLEAGEAWIDPVFGSWKIVFADVTRKYETISFRASGKEGSLTYMSINNREVKIPYYYDASNDVIKLGRSTRPLLLPGETYSGTPEKVQLLYTTSSGDTRVLELTDTTCSGTKSEISILDKTTGNVLAKNKKLQNACDGTEETIQLSGLLGSVKLIIAPDSVEYVKSSQHGDGTPQTKYRGTLSIASDEISFTEKKGRNTATSVVGFSPQWNGGKAQIEVADVTEDGGSISWITEKGESSKMQSKMQVTEKGTKISLWTTKIVLEAPENDVSADVFLTPVSATIQASSPETVTKVNKFDASFVVLDSEAKSMDKNMIVVGGPCANSIAAEVLREPFGNPYDCTTGFTPGKAMIKLLERKGRTVLLVAGYSAEDTVAATEVLSSYKDYVLAGGEVEVTRTSSGGLQVAYK
jgi:hypothetical protein